MMLNKSAIRKFVKERNPKIRRITKSYFEMLNVKVERMVIASTIQNLSRKTLTHNELTGVNGNGKAST